MAQCIRNINQGVFEGEGHSRWVQGTSPVTFWVAQLLATLHKIFHRQAYKSPDENEPQEALFTPLNLSTEQRSPGLFYKYPKVQRKQQLILTQANRNVPRAAGRTILQCHPAHEAESAAQQNQRGGRAELSQARGAGPQITTSVR